MHGSLATKTRGAGGASGLLSEARALELSTRRAYLKERGVSAQPLGVELGEAWNRPLGDTWSHELALRGSIGGTVLA